MADGTINIDVNIPIEKAESDVQKLKNLFSDVGDEAGDKLDKSFEENTDKVESKAESTHKKVVDIFGKDAEQKIKGNNSDLNEKVSDSKAKLKQLPEETKTKLIADAKMNGIDNFESLLKKLPKSKQTELLTKVNDGEVVDYEELLRKIPSKHVTEVKLNDNASSGLRKLKDEADNTGSRFSRLKDIIVGSFAGQLVFNGINALQEGMKELISSSVEYNKEQQVSLASWTTLTNSASKGQAMVDMANNLSTKFGQARDITDELDQQFYHVLDNADKTQTLTTSFLTLADTIGLSSDQVKTLGQDFTHTMSSGKMQLGDFNQVADYLPMFGENLLKYEQKVQNNSKLTMSQLQAEMSAGKISATDAMNVINQLGDKYKASADNMMNTLPGMERSISAKAPALVSAFINPFLTAENPIAKAVMKWVNDPKTMSEMQSAGKSFSTTMTGISKAIVDALPDIKSIGGSLLSIAGTIGKAVWSVFSGTIKAIAEAFNALSGNSNKGKSGLDAVAEALKKISSYKGEIKTLTEMILAGFASYKIVSGIAAIVGGFKTFVTALNSGKTAMVAFDAVSDLNPFGLIAAAIAVVVVGLIAAYKHIKPFRDAINALWNDVKKLFTGKLGWEQAIAKELSSIQKVWNSFWGSVGKTLSSWGKTISKTWSSIWSGIEKVSSVIWNGIKVAAGLAFKSIVYTALAPLILMVATISAIWKLIEKPTLAAWNLIKQYIVKPIQDAYKSVVDYLKQLLKDIEDIWNAIKKFTMSIWNPIKDFIVDVAEDIWKAVTRTFNRLASDVSNIWNGIKSVTVGVWNAISGWVISKAEGIWKGITGVFNSLKNDISGILDAISSKWHDMWNGVSSFFSSIWKDIKGVAKDGINGVIDFLNGGINGIDTVVHFFGGSKKAISDIPKLAKGSGPVKNGTPAIVNDEQASDFREAILRKDGSVDIPTGRNVLTYLDEGDSVVPAAITKSIFGDIPQYAGGTGDWLGKLWNGTKSFISSASDKAKSIADAIAHPLKTIKGIFSKVTNSAKGVWSTLASSAGGYLANSAVNWFKKALSGLKDAIDGDAGGNSPNPGGSGVKRWKDDVKRALAANGLSTSDDMVAKVLRQIATESGGNPHAKQPGADPDGDGSGPALGLMQTKRATFEANKFPGHGDIWNGYDDILAGLHYAKKRYGPSLSFLGNGHGYAFGGSGDQEGLYRLFEGNQKEFVVPNPSVAGVDRAYTVLGQAAAYLGSKGNMQSNNSSALENAVNKLVSLQSAANTKLEKSINKKVQVVLDTGKMVGAMYSKIDQKGYSANTYQQRNVWW